jgi:hypothetical protein
VLFADHGGHSGLAAAVSDAATSSVLFLGDRMTPNLIVGGLLAICGVAITQPERRVVATLESRSTLLPLDEKLVTNLKCADLASLPDLTLFRTYTEPAIFVRTCMSYW